MYLQPIPMDSKAAIPPRKPRLSFLDLSPDVRNLIYSYNLIHHENEGVINPILRKPPEKPYGYWNFHPYTEDIIPVGLIDGYINGKRMLMNIDYYISTVGTATFLIEKMDKDPEECKSRKMPEHWDDAIGCSAEEFKRQMEREGWEEGDIIATKRRHPFAGGKEKGQVIVGHMCTLGCLAQPNISRLNRQIRSEALSYFYQFNKFRLTFRGSEIVDSCVWRWLQSVGDPNFHSMRDLALLFHPRILPI